MAEVKTYKCDICGEVYHVGEDIKAFMNIEYARGTDENVYIEAKFNHICPECRNTICKCINKPKIIDELHEKTEDLAKIKHTLRNYIDRLKPMLDDGLRQSLLYADYSKLETYDRIVIGANDSYERMEKSCAIWKRIAFAAIGLLIGVIGGLILRNLG